MILNLPIKYSIPTHISWVDGLAKRTSFQDVDGFISIGCSYLQGEGLQLLSGEKQRTLQDQIATAQATRTVLEQENREMEERVSH